MLVAAAAAFDQYLLPAPDVGSIGANLSFSSS